MLYALFLHIHTVKKLVYERATRIGDDGERADQRAEAPAREEEYFECLTNSTLSGIISEVDSVPSACFNL